MTEPRVCPSCGEAMERVVMKFTTTTYIITKTGMDIDGDDRMEWNKDAYCCPNCYEEIPAPIAEAVFRANNEEG